jgi:hypothetical protein
MINGSIEQKYENRELEEGRLDRLHRAAEHLDVLGRQQGHVLGV